MAINGETSGLRGSSPSFEYVTHKKPVISGLTGTYALKESESGSLVLLDRAAGLVLTLPLAKPGLNFEFLTNVTNTSNVYKIISSVSSGTQAMIGALQSMVVQDGTALNTITSAATTNNIAVTMDGATKGGRVGSRISVSALSSGSWFVSGLIVGTGTIASPFAVV